MKNAAILSRILREAGIPKAGRYSAWGYEPDGFIVFSANRRGAGGDRHRIAITFKRDRGREMFDRIIEVLEANEIAYRVSSRNGLGGDYGVDVPVDG